MPYRTYDDRIDGLVITFINISDHKRLEEKLLENEKMFHLLLGASSDIKVVLSDDMKVLEFNHEAELFFGKKREDSINKNFIQMFVPEGSQISTEKNIKMLLGKGLNDKLKMKVTAANGKISVVECFLTVSLDDLNMAEGMILSINKI
jgi:two-component system CheB/CheR fusion protein